MSNLKIAVEKLANKLSLLTSNEADEILNEILNSYELFTKFNGQDRKEAFIDSIYTPTSDRKYRKEIKRNKELSKMINDEKYLKLKRFDGIIVMMHQNNMDFSKISKYLNGKYVHQKNYFTSEDIKNYIEENLMEDINDK